MTKIVDFSFSLQNSLSWVVLPNFTSLTSLTITNLDKDSVIEAYSISCLKNLSCLNIEGGIPLDSTEINKLASLPLISLKISCELPTIAFSTLKTFCIYNYPVQHGGFSLNDNLKRFLLQHKQLESFRVFNISYCSIYEEECKWIRRNCPKLVEFIALACTFDYFLKCDDIVDVQNLLNDERVMYGRFYGGQFRKYENMEQEERFYYEHFE